MVLLLRWLSWVLYRHDKIIVLTPRGYSTGLDRRFYGETVTLISTREIQDSERTSTQSKQFVRNDDTN